MSDIRYRLLNEGDEAVLAKVADGVFDHQVVPEKAKAFLAEPRYEMVVALDDDLVVGMATGFTYFHPDKDDEFFINEVGVGDAYLRRGIGTELMKHILARAKKLGCTYAWLGTELDNVEANALYRKLECDESEIKFYEFKLDK